MKKSRNSRRVLMAITLFVGSMITLLPRQVHAQQEMSPDFYDPWAKPATVVHGPQVAVSGRRHQSSAKVAGAQRRAERLHAKRLVSKSTAS